MHCFISGNKTNKQFGSHLFYRESTTDAWKGASNVEVVLRVAG